MKTAIIVLIAAFYVFLPDPIPGPIDDALVALVAAVLASLQKSS